MYIWSYYYGWIFYSFVLFYNTVIYSHYKNSLEEYAIAVIIALTFVPIAGFYGNINAISLVKIFYMMNVSSSIDLDKVGMPLSWILTICFNVLFNGNKLDKVSKVGKSLWINYWLAQSEPNIRTELRPRPNPTRPDPTRPGLTNFSALGCARRLKLWGNIKLTQKSIFIQRSRLQTPIRNLQHPPKPQMMT